MRVQCGQCSHQIFADADKRLPPWCPRCGADLKPARAVAAAASCPVSQSAETAVRNGDQTFDRAVRSSCQAETKLEQVQPTRFQLDWSEPVAFRRAVEPPPSRLVIWIRNTLLILAGLFVPGLFALHYFGEMFFSKLVVAICVPVGTGLLCIIAIPLVMMFAMRHLSYYAVIGPNGVSRTQIIPLGHHMMVRGWTIPWHDIEEVLYLEDCPLGERVWKVLVVGTADGEQKLIGIADHVSHDQLAATLKGWDQELEMASAADLGHTRIPKDEAGMTQESPITDGE